MLAGSNDYAGWMGRDLTLLAKACLMDRGAKELRKFQHSGNANAVSQANADSPGRR